MLLPDDLETAIAADDFRYQEIAFEDRFGCNQAALDQIRGDIGRSEDHSEIIRGESCRLGGRQDFPRGCGVRSS